LSLTIAMYGMVDASADCQPLRRTNTRHDGWMARRLEPHKHSAARVLARTPDVDREALAEAPGPKHGSRMRAESNVRRDDGGEIAGSSRRWPSSADRAVWSINLGSEVAHRDSTDPAQACDCTFLRIIHRPASAGLSRIRHQVRHHRRGRAA
jgi:hypothetical protein